MNIQEKLFTEIGQKMKDSQHCQMFGKPCFKIKGKAFICFFNDCMVFKLAGSIHNEALKMSGAILFDPSGKKHPMKEWVQLPFSGKGRWEEFANAAYDYVAGAI